MESRLLVVIPAFNEAESIAAVVAGIRRHKPSAEVVVINDGSTDDSAERAQAAGATVISLPYNLGIGGAVQTGYRYAVRRRPDVVLRMDGDGQHDAQDIPRILQPIVDGEADVVIGSRFALGGTFSSPLARALGIRFFSLLVRLVTGQRFTDPTSGFGACNGAAARFLAQHMPVDYPEIEGILLLHRAGFHIQEVPVTMHPRHGGVSSIGSLRAVYYVLKVTLAVMIGQFRSWPQPGGREG